MGDNVARFFLIHFSFFLGASAKRERESEKKIFFHRNASDGLTPSSSLHASYVQNPIATPGATL